MQKKKRNYALIYSHLKKVRKSKSHKKLRNVSKECNKIHLHKDIILCTDFVILSTQLKYIIK